MPFDGTDTFDTHPLAKLGAVERLLATEQQWCKGRLRDAHGRHCLVGAIEAVGGRQVLQKVVLQAAREVSGKRYWRIEFFNDDPRTTHCDVLQVLHRARENLIAGMVNEYDRLPWYKKWMRAMRTPFSQPSGGNTPAIFSAKPATTYPDFETGLFVEPRGQKDRAAVLELQD